MAALVAVGLVLGGPHYDAINYHKTNSNLRGISEGIVLGASGESNAFIRGYFVSNSADRNRNLQYPNQTKTFQAAYLTGLVKGIEYGRKLNHKERRLFFRHLDILLKKHPPGKFWNTKHAIRDGMVRRNYYVEAAIAFRTKTFRKQ